MVNFSELELKNRLCHLKYVYLIQYNIVYIILFNETALILGDYPRIDLQTVELLFLPDFIDLRKNISLITYL